MKSHVKGSLVVGVVKALRAHEAEARRYLPAGLGHYLDDRVLISEWYPELEALELYRVMSKVVRGLGSDPFVTMGRMTAHDHATSVYKNIVAWRTVDGLFDRTETLWKAQHDVGDMRTLRREPGSADIELVNHTCLNDEWCRLLSGYLVGMVDAVGGKDVRCAIVEKDLVRKRALFRISYTA